MSLAAWFRRWNSPEARQKRRKARDEAWAEANSQKEAMRNRHGPSWGSMRSSYYDDDEEC